MRRQGVGSASTAVAVAGVVLGPVMDEDIDVGEADVEGSPDLAAIAARVSRDLGLGATAPCGECGSDRNCGGDRRERYRVIPSVGLGR